MLWFKIILFSVTIFGFGHSYKIFAIFSLPLKSHYILVRKLFSELANRGHEVTLITPYVQENPVKNLKQIQLENLQDFFTGMASTILEQEKETLLRHSTFVNYIHYNVTKFVLAHETFQKALKSEEHYDAVILYYVLNEAFFPIAQHFKAPLILVKSMPLFVSDSFLLSHPISSSYVPNLLTEYTGRMNFWERLKNTFHDLTMIVNHQWDMLPKHRQLVRDYIPGSPDLYNFLNNESLLLINSDVSTNEVSPKVPNAVDIGGFHIEDPKPLPSNLKEFLDNSTNGVVPFSMGSISRSADLPIEKRDSLIKSFSKLKENVLWKFEEDLPGLPKNIKTMKWIPQSDVLAHPNVKLFLTHCGLLSILESVYHGVPIVGIPVFANQRAQMASAISQGYAVKVSYSELNEEALSQALNEVLGNQKYRENVKRRSQIMRDRPVSALDMAMFRIENVIRHKGVSYLKYPGGFQRNFLDVAVFAFCIIMGVGIIFSFIFKASWKIQRKSKRD